MNLTKLTIAASMLVVANSCTSSMQLVTRPDGQSSCKIYIRPQREPLPPLPDIPRRVDSEELNEIQARYVQQLRSFVASERAKEDDHYLNYLSRCLK